MTTFAIIVAVAAIGIGLSRALRLPLAPAVLLTAVLSKFVPVSLDQANIETALAVSATFLVFVLGAAMDPRGALGRPAALLVVGKLLTLGGLAALASIAVGFDLQTALWLGLALSASSSLTAAELLRRRERMFEPVGRLLTSGLLAHDGVTIVLLTLLIVSGRTGFDAAAAGLGFVGLGALAWVTRRWVVPSQLCAPGADDEQQLLTVLGVLSAFLGVSLLAGLPLVAGAFFAGLSLAPFPSGGIVRGHVGAFRDFFLPLFLASLGMVLTLPGPAELLVVLVAIAAIIIVQPLILIPLGRRAGLTLHEAVEGSLLLGTSGELALIVAITGTAEGRIDASSLHVVAVVAVITMGLLPWTASSTLARRIVSRVPARPASAPPPGAGHVIVVGCGAHSRAIIDRLHEAGIGLVVLDHDPDVIAQLAARGIPGVRGDARSPRDLARAGSASARAFISTLPDPKDTARVMEVAQGRPVWATVFEPVDGEALASLGAAPIVSATATTEDFLSWFDDWRGSQHKGSHPDGAVPP